MSKPFKERNASDTAKRKLKNLAKAAGLEVELVTILANFTWDYDPNPTEPTGWVDNRKLPASAHKQLEQAAEWLEIPSEIRIDRREAESVVLASLKKSPSEQLWENFCAAASTKNFGHVSKFASAHYLRGATRPRMKALDWGSDDVALLGVVRNLFLKFFRGGAIERYELGYLWTDLCISLPYSQSTEPASCDWLLELLDRIEALPEGAALKDLLSCCKGLVGGSKWFKQEVLQALAYADVIQVNALPVSKMFIPKRRNELSGHFYSNEWSFPLRFWAENGGVVNRSAIPNLG